MSREIEIMRVEVNTDHGWIERPFEQIKKGDVFRMFEPDGKPVVNACGHTEYKAETNAFNNAEGVPSIRSHGIR